MDQYPVQESTEALSSSVGLLLTSINMLKGIASSNDAILPVKNKTGHGDHDDSAKSYHHWSLWTTDLFLNSLKSDYHSAPPKLHGDRDACSLMSQMTLCHLPRNVH